MTLLLTLAAALLSAGPASAKLIRRVEVLGPVRIRGQAAMMHGPRQVRAIEFSKPVLLRSLRVELREPDGTPARTPANLCHVTFSYPRGRKSPWQILTLDATTPRFDFPPGYGFPLEPGQRYFLNAMLFSDDASVDRKLEFVVTFELQDDPLRAGVKPLRLGQVGIRASDAGSPGYSGPFDWLVPPGRHEYSRVGPAPFSGKLFMIAPHLHPHVAGYGLEDEAARSALVDMTIAPRTSGLAPSVGDSVFVSSSGVTLSADRRYRWSVVYDNETDRPVPVMASFELFYSP